MPAGGVAPWIKLWPITKRARVRIVGANKGDFIICNPFFAYKAHNYSQLLFPVVTGKHYFQLKLKLGIIQGIGRTQSMNESSRTSSYFTSGNGNSIVFFVNFQLKHFIQVS